MMMMIATTRSTPSGIVTFKDLQTLLSSFFTLRNNHKKTISQKQRLDAVVLRAPRAKKEWERERVSCDE